jgi:hypothetical protein
MNDDVFLGLQSFNCAATQWGEMYEDEARNIYSSRKGVDVEQTGFIQYTKYSGGSPDGVVQSDNGLVEIKCPYNPEKHIDFMLMETQEDLLTLNKQYYYQCQANMMFCNKDYIDFVSYDPRLSELISMKILRINPDYKAFALIESRIELAQERLEEMVSNLTKIGIEQLKLS